MYITMQFFMYRLTAFVEEMPFKKKKQNNGDMLDIQSITNQDNLLNTLAMIAKANWKCHICMSVFM